MSDQYYVAEGALNLKGGLHKKKKKKKSKEHKHKLEANTSRADDKLSDDGEQRNSRRDRITKTEMTKAEKSFKKMQEKKRLERIMEKASKSHRQRVEDFNAKLDNLSEHYDVPKVSWTK